MKIKLLVAALALSMPTVAAAKPFDFMSLNTTATYSGEMMVGGKKCKLKGAGQESCFRYYGAQIGTVPIMGLQTNFNNGHFILVSGTAVGSFFSDLADAFKAKYGAPTKTETEKWQNKMGATFDNTVLTWQFDDGRLELRAMGNMRDETSFNFVSSDNLPPKQEQPVNF
ncbi:hypothetical protein ACXY7D_11920 [Sphingomonas melonis]